MIESVLVANRGEIAVRVIRTSRRLGIRTIGVFSDADAQALQVSLADDAVYIGGSPASESYLNIEQILAAAAQTRAQAVHPGYGFLSENPEFAESVIRSGLIWIGPPPRAMRALGDKARAKALATEHDVPVLDGYHGENQAPEILAAQATRIGYPLLIKASAGGGGRGMRVVNSPDEFSSALEAARREALAAFADDRVLLERYVARPRHVEIQIVGDEHGNLIHLGERECSIQRRHQKLIEESPSPAVDPDLRQRMGDAALRLARAAGYCNAGTVEFLLEENRAFAFLEVNARLQVEHPVTEAITGLDLVELQLRVASGEPLPVKQSDVTFHGHAIEARVIAEDALAGFLPSSGGVTRVSLPENVRVDTWITDHARVSPYYDSLLAKVIAHAPDRPSASRQLASALEVTRIDGIRNNIDLLLAVVQAPAFLDGGLNTAFLEDNRLVEQLADVPSEVLAAASAFDHFQPVGWSDPWQALTGWRVARLDQPSTWTYADREHPARVSADADGRTLRVEFGIERHAVERLGSAGVRVEGEPVHVMDHEDLRIVEFRGRSYRLRRAQALTVEATGSGRGVPGSEGRLTAPMPGRIVKVAVKPGDRVEQNQPLVVLEAMKMEHLVEAPRAGVVSEVYVEAGEQVPNGARLLTLSSAEPPLR